MAKFLLLMAICGSLLRFSFQQTIQNVKDIQTLLFTTNSYSKNVRPASDQSKPVEVSVDLTLYSIDDFSMVEQKLTTTAYLTLNWIDDELQWTPSSYGGVSELFLPQEDIWKPDVILENVVSGINQLGDKSLLVRVHSNGSVEWRPYDSFLSKCSVDTSYYPFDEQLCFFKFNGWSTNAEQVKFVTASDGIDLSKFEENGEWMMLGTSAVNETSGTESCVKFEIKLRRRPILIMINIIIPIIYLGIINCYLFILPVESGEKIGYAVTLFLSLAVFLTLISDTLPQNATQIPAITIYLTVRALLGTLSVMAAITQLNFYYRDESEPIPRFLKLCHSLSSNIKQCTCCCKGSKVYDDYTIEKKPESHDPEPDHSYTSLDWKTLTKSLDFLYLMLFLMAEMIFASFFFITSSLNLPY